MEEQEINEIIAKFCRWKKVSPYKNWGELIDNQWIGPWRGNFLPEFCKDLNEMARAEIFLAGKDSCLFAMYLRELKGNISASAIERANTFVKVIKTQKVNQDYKKKVRESYSF